MEAELLHLEQSTQACQGAVTSDMNTDPFQQLQAAESSLQLPVTNLEGLRKSRKTVKAILCDIGLEWCRTFTENKEDEDLVTWNYRYTDWELLTQDGPPARHKRKALANAPATTEQQSLAAKTKKPRSWKKMQPQDVPSTWACQLCGFTTANIVAFESHVRGKHGANMQDCVVLGCALCPFRGPRLAMEEHATAQHDGGQLAGGDAVAGDNAVAGDSKGMPGRRLAFVCRLCRQGHTAYGAMWTHVAKKHPAAFPTSVVFAAPASALPPAPVSVPLLPKPRDGSPPAGEPFCRVRCGRPEGDRETLPRRPATSRESARPCSLAGYPGLAPSCLSSGGAQQRQYVCSTQLLGFRSPVPSLPSPPLLPPAPPPLRSVRPSVWPSGASVAPAENGRTVSSLQVDQGSRFVAPLQNYQFCEACKELVTSKEFPWHISTCYGLTSATGSGPSVSRAVPCPLCNVTLLPAALRVHMLQHQLRCRRCLLVFNGYDTLLEHMLKEHLSCKNDVPAVLESRAAISAVSSAGCLSAPSQTSTNDFQVPENSADNAPQPQCTVSYITQPCVSATGQAQPSNASPPVFTLTLPPVAMSAQVQQPLLFQLVPQQSVLTSQSQQLSSMPALLTLNLSQTPQSSGVPHIVSITPALPSTQPNQQLPALPCTVANARAVNGISTGSNGAEGSATSRQEPPCQQADSATLLRLAVASPAAASVSGAAAAQVAANPCAASSVVRLQNGTWASGGANIMMTVPQVCGGMMPQTIAICNSETGRPLQLLLQSALAPAAAYSGSAQVAVATKGVVTCDANPAAGVVSSAAGQPMQQYVVTVNSHPAGPVTMSVNQTPAPVMRTCPSSGCLLPPVSVAGDAGSAAALPPVNTASPQELAAQSRLVGQVQALCVFCGVTVQGSQQQIAAMVERHLNTTHGVSQTFDRKKNIVKYYCFYCKVQYHYPLYVNALDAHKKHCPMQIIESVLEVTAGAKDDRAESSVQEASAPHEATVGDRETKASVSIAAPRVAVPRLAVPRLAYVLAVRDPSSAEPYVKIQRETTAAALASEGCTVQKAACLNNGRNGSTELALDPTEHVDKSYDERKRFLVEYFNRRPYPNQQEVALLTERLWMRRGDAATLFACKRNACLRTIKRRRPHVLLGFSVEEMQGLNHSLVFPAPDSPAQDVNSRGMLALDKPAMPRGKGRSQST